jgi:hypothetical protein
VKSFRDWSKLRRACASRKDYFYIWRNEFADSLYTLPNQLQNLEKKRGFSAEKPLFSFAENAIYEMVSFGRIVGKLFSSVYRYRFRFER